jgi:hypothetical protein
MPQSFLIFFVIFLSGLTWSCSTDKNPSTSRLQIQGRFVTLPDSTQTYDMDGRILAMAYCQSCHLYPEPSLLTKDIWKKHVLPNMAMRLGVNTATDPYSRLSDGEINNVVKNQVFAFQRLIPMRDWEKIEAYYLQEAPAEPLPQESKLPPISGLPGFSPWIPALSMNITPLLTLVQYDKASKSLYVGDRRKNLFTYNQHLQLTDSIQLPSVPAHLLTEKGNTWLLTMGFMDPSDDYAGQLLVKEQTSRPL